MLRALRPTLIACSPVLAADEAEFNHTHRSRGNGAYPAPPALLLSGSFALDCVQ